MKRLLLAFCLTGCALTPAQQTTVETDVLVALKVACLVDSVVVPIAQPVVASLGPTGAAISAADLLAHPAVVAACSAINGTPASVDIALPTS